MIKIRKKKNIFIYSKYVASVVCAYGAEDEDEKDGKSKNTIPNVYDNPIGHATTSTNNSDAAGLAVVGATITGGLKGAAAAAALVAPTSVTGPAGLAATGIAAGGGFVLGGLSAGAVTYGANVAYQCAGCHLGNDGQNYEMEPKKDD